LVQVVFEDGFDADVGTGFKVQRPPTRPPRVGRPRPPCQPDDPQAGTDPCSGWGRLVKMVWKTCAQGGADLLAPGDHAARRPLEVR